MGIYTGFPVRVIPGGARAAEERPVQAVPAPPPPPPGEKATAAQIKMIWGLAKKIGLDGEALRAKALAITGKAHVSSLTRGDAGKLIDALMGRPVPVYRPPAWDEDADGRPLCRASQKQINYILALGRQLGWNVDGNRERLLGFVRERFHTTFLDWLEPDQANDVIQALKSMLAGGRGERKKVPDANG